MFGWNTLAFARKSVVWLLKINKTKLHKQLFLVISKLAVIEAERWSQQPTLSKPSSPVL